MKPHIKNLFLLPALIAAFGLIPAGRVTAQTPTILASGVGAPDQIIIDNSTVYWGDAFTGAIRSVSKNPGGTVTVYTSSMTPLGQLVQDNASLYFMGPTAGLTHPIIKMSKTGGLVTPLGFAGTPHGAIAMGPALGVLYYEGERRNIPGPTPPDTLPRQTSVVASRPTAGGNETPLVWDSSEAGDAAALQAAGLNSAPFGPFMESTTTDSVWLYWTGAFVNDIWRMNLITSAASPFLPGRNSASSLVAPMQGAAQGSLFWLEFDASFNLTRVMRRNVGGQISMLIDGVDSYFAVDGDKVFCEQGGRLVQVSIDGGTPTTLVDAAQAHSPWGIAVDTNFIYWSTTRGEIMRLPRSGSTPGSSSTPVITTHPGNQTVTAGQNVSFTVAATGDPTPTYQWQSAPAGGAFTNVAGATSATLTVPAVTAASNGNQYRAVATNSLGSATSNAATLTVTTTGGICTFTISATAAVFSSSGGTGTMTVTPSASSCAWTASSNAGFLTITTGASGTGPGAVTYAITGLASGTRTAMLTAGGQTLTITQSGLDTSGCSFSLSSTGATVPLAGGTGTVTVTPSPSTCLWGATSNVPFIAVTAGAAGTGTRTVTYAASSVSTPRAGTMTIAGQTFTVTQTGASCTYSMSPVSVNFGALGSFGDIAVTTGTDCPWTTVAHDAFVTIVSGASGTGSGTVRYSVSDNISLIPRFPATARMGTLTVAGRTFPVTQEGEVSCSYTLSPTGLAPTNGGGTYTVLVSTSSANTSCSWTAAARDSWLTVLSGSIGSLSGSTVVYVAPNVTGTPRTGTVNIAGNSLAVVQGSGPVVTLAKLSLAFAATSSGTGFNALTPPQVARLSQAGAGTVTWTATSSKPWLTVSPASGTGPGDITIGVAFDNSVAAAGTTNGTITVTVFGESGAPQLGNMKVIDVTLGVVAAATPPAVPFGVVDTPAGDATPLSGSVAVTGWTLDNVGVKRVELWRDLQAGETTPPFASTASDPRTGKVFIANATFVDGARPDVEGLHPTTPFNYRAGWGYLMLTRGLWNQGNGTYSLYAFAFDQEDNVATMGKKTIVVNNTTATKPFGSIDTPAIGGDASGPNFGWGLTPPVNGIATCRIPSSGVQVSIDSGPLQPVVYGSARTDIAGAFPGFSNTAAAGGHYLFDWTALTNGPHTIGWLITDDCNRADGVGSRFFNVTGGTNLTADTAFVALSTPAASLRAGESESADPITVARGYGELPEIVKPGEGGSRTIDVKQGDRIEVRLPRGFASAYQLVSGGQIRGLPIGSSWDAGSGMFYWQPAPGFLGRYRIVFSNGTQRIMVRVVVLP